MRESAFTQSVHRYLQGRCYVWKISDRYHAGIPDAYYAGDAGVLWAEHKYDPDPRGTLKPNLSKLQARWLRQHHAMNISTACILGTPQGTIIYSGLSWTKPITVAQLATFGKTRQQVAEWIITVVGQLPYVGSKTEPD